MEEFPKGNPGTSGHAGSFDYWYPLVPVTQGDNQGQRQGNKIYAKFFMLKFNFTAQDQTINNQTVNYTGSALGRIQILEIWPIAGQSGDALSTLSSNVETFFKINATNLDGITRIFPWADRKLESVDPKQCGFWVKRSWTVKLTQLLYNAGTFQGYTTVGGTTYMTGQKKLTWRNKFFQYENDAATIPQNCNIPLILICNYYPFKIDVLWTSKFVFATL